MALASTGKELPKLVVKMATPQRRPRLVARGASCCRSMLIGNVDLNLCSLASCLCRALIVCGFLMMLVGAGQCWSRPAKNRLDSHPMLPSGDNSNPNDHHAQHHHHQHHHSTRLKHHHHKPHHHDHQHHHRHHHHHQHHQQNSRNQNHDRTKHLSLRQVYDNLNTIRKHEAIRRQLEANWTQTEVFRVRRGLARQATILSRLQILESYDALLNEFALENEQQQTANESSINANIAQDLVKQLQVDFNTSTSISDVDDEDLDQLCLLKLPFQWTKKLAHDPAATECRCLKPTSASPAQHDGQLALMLLNETSSTRKIPPYIENLYKRLARQASSRTEAVRLMPYDSLAMRSFRQPEIIAQQMQAANSMVVDNDTFERKTTFKNKTNSPPESPDGQAKAEAATSKDIELVPNLVVELSLLDNEQPIPNIRATQLKSRLNEQHWKTRDQESNQNSEQTPGQPAKPDKRPVEEMINVMDRRSRRFLVSPMEACKMHERLLPVEQRTKLCYWFPISDPMASRLNGSSSSMVERLVEAELHLYKLKPLLNHHRQWNQHHPSGQVNAPSVQQHLHHKAQKAPYATTNRATRASPEWEAKQNVSSRALAASVVVDSTTDKAANTNQQIQQTRWMAQDQPEADDRRQLGPSNLYQLKTNLLEVSLFQVLPPVNQSARHARNLKPGEIIQENNHFPLRLLDIRRIDLHSTGWEAFYVKRAVEDWIRDASLNLGLVIKTKSMFDEPIRIGLIRFADLYDSMHQDEDDGDGTRWAPGDNQPTDADVDHQPTLIVYTTSVEQHQ